MWDSLDFLLSPSRLKSDGPEDLYSDLNNELKCNICMEVFKNPVVTPWEHCFWEECIVGLIFSKGSKKQCPMCRRPLSKRDLTHVTKLSNVWNIISRIKLDFNMQTQLAPVRKFEINKSQIKRQLQLQAKALEEIKEEAEPITETQNDEKVLKRNHDKHSDSEDNKIDSNKNKDSPKIGRKRKYITDQKLSIVEETKSRAASTRASSKEGRVFGADITNTKKAKNSLNEYRKSKNSKKNPFAINNSKRMNIHGPSTINIKLRNVSKQRKSKRNASSNKSRDLSKSEGSLFNLAKIEEYGFWGSQLSNSQKKLLDTFCLNYEVPIDEDVFEETTHLIIPDKIISGKYIKAILQQTNIISIRWIEKWMSYNPPVLVPINEFIIFKAPEEDENKSNSKISSLFKNMNFVVSSHLKSIPQLKSVNLSESIEEMGGNVFRSLNTALKDLRDSENKETLYLISDCGDSIGELPQNLKHSTKLLKVHYNWLIEWVVAGKIVEPVLLN